MKLVICSKKHYKIIMNNLKEVKPKENEMFPGYLGSLGEPFRFEIKPYLKKIRVINEEMCQVRMIKEVSLI